MFIPVVQGVLAQQGTQVRGHLSHAGEQLAHGGLPGLISGSVGQLSAGGAGSSSSGSSPPRVPSSGGSGGSHGSSGSGGSAATQVTTKTQIVVRYRTRYRTVVRDVLPNIPAGAMLPSTDIVSVPRFAVGRNIVCYITTGGARCDIGHHPWLPATPVPSSCHHAWGNALQVAGASPSRFLCTDTSLLSIRTRSIKPGYDVVEGAVRCEVRSFGVNCFVTDHHGFVLSQSGYLRY